MFLYSILLLALSTAQSSAECDAPRNCSYIHNCTAETGVDDLHCYDLINDKHRCGYRKDLPTELGVKIPFYNAIGAYRRVPDNAFKASSNSREAAYARIGSAKRWCAEKNDSDPWLEIDFGIPTDIERIELKGDPQKNNWEQKFSVSYNDGNGLKNYRNGHIFTSTSSDYCQYVFINKTTSIRIMSSTTSTCLQLAVYGNPPDPQIPIVVQPVPKPVTTQPTAKLLNQESLTADDFFKNYLLWAIFLAVFIFLLIFFLTFLLCWCCRRPREFDKSNVLVTSEKQQNYVPSWRTIDARAEHGYVATQEVQEVKIAFSDEYIPPDLKKEKLDPNDEKYYTHKIFGFESRVKEGPGTDKPNTGEHANK